MELLTMSEAFTINEGLVDGGRWNLFQSGDILKLGLWTVTEARSINLEYFQFRSGQKYYIGDLFGSGATRASVVGAMLALRFGENWKRLYATLKPPDYDPLTNYKMEETAEGTESSTRTPDLTKGDTGTVQTTGQDKRTPDLTKGDTGTVQTTGQDRRTPDLTKGDTGTVQTTGQDKRTPDLTKNDTGTIKNDGSATSTNQNNLWGFNSTTSVPSDMADGSATNENTATRNLTETETGTDTTDRTNTDTYNRSYTESGTDTTDRTNTDTYNRSYTETGTDTTERTNTDTYNRSYTETGTDTTSGKSSRKLTRTGNIGTNTFQNLINQERDLWKWNFYEQVFRDVDSVLTIPIY